MKTFVYSIHGFDKAPLEKAAAGKHELVFSELPLNKETASLAAGCEAVALFTSDIASAEVLEKLAACGVKYLALRSVGYEHIDLEKAKMLGLKAANVPEYSPYAIAEHAVALLMALNRKLLAGQELMDKGDFRLDALTGFDLHGKTVGVVGTGKIGSAFSRIMNGFGCKLLGYDVEPDPELQQQTNMVYTSLEALCQEADVISVSCPLNAATKYMFDQALFAQMKKGVVFINTARGGIVNTLALMEALDNQIIGAAGLDVYEYEKPIFFYDHSSAPIQDELFLKLRAYPNVLITGHQAFLTNEALHGIATTTVANLDAWSVTGASANDLN